MATIDPDRLCAFAEDGYVVLPQVVSADLADAARREIAVRVHQEPPPDRRGPHFYFLSGDLPRPLLAALFESGALRLAEALIAPGWFEAPDHVQISLNIPVWDHRPGGPHIDGLTPPEPDGRPGTFTLLLGILLTDQSRHDAGNLWVWPGSHRASAAYLREAGPDALASSIPYPPVALPQPVQVTGRAGDVLLAHYMLGHNMGGNTSGVTREVVYFRLRRAGHRDRWREVVQDPLLEYEPVRAAVNAKPRAR